MKKHHVALLIYPLLICIFCSCNKAIAQQRPNAAEEEPGVRIKTVEKAAAILRPSDRDAFLAVFRANTERFFSLLQQLGAGHLEPEYLLALVDNTHELPAAFIPSNLVPLDGAGISITKPGMKLDRVAWEALIRMARAARADGVDLTVASAYRSYDYQVGLFARNVEIYGEKEASRFSARAGFSQHQLGTVVDFSPVEDAFADTAAGKWVAANAARFGFSLSYPEGMEDVTGFVGESWHYRYIGDIALLLQSDFFNGVQQCTLEFISAWKALLP